MQTYILLLFFGITTYSNGFQNLPMLYNDGSKQYMKILDNDFSIDETGIDKLFLKYRNLSGIDETYVKNETYDNELLEKIKISFIKFNLLKTLESSNISMNRKVDLLHENRHLFEKTQYVNNIKEGGLFKDWDFSM